MSLQPTARSNCMIAVLATLLPCVASASDDGFVLFLDEYLYGDSHVAELDRDLYAGTLDVGRSRTVLECDGNICLYPAVLRKPVVASDCELRAPAFDPSGYAVSYAARCGDAASDRILQTNLLTAETVEVPNADGGADRFAQFANDGCIVYSHIDASTGTSSLWAYDSEYAIPLFDRTISDDDPYPDKHDGNHIAFIGWQRNGYVLLVYRADRNDAVQLTRGISVLEPVLFRR